jgi:magnesium transporter
MSFNIDKFSLEHLKALIKENQQKEISELLHDLHYADLAEIMDELDSHEAAYIFKALDSEKTAEILLELDPVLRQKILKSLSAREIADQLNELSTDDAADIISEIPHEKKAEVISQIDDADHAKDIVELSRYDDDTAGGLMAKELVKVNENWNMLTCVKEMRLQAENVERVHSIYVIDDEGKLKGRLSLKDLLTTSTKTPISEIYIKRVDFVNVNTKDVEVARIMQKYDLEAIPVVNELGVLVGRITIDDIVDVIRDEADKDYQLAAGISQDVEADDNILTHTKARLPWLILALIGGFAAVKVAGGYEDAIEKYSVLFYFTPLIAAMAGNVGVQSSAIIVQGLANGSLTGTIWKMLSKEVTLSLLNGFILSLLLMIGTYTLLDVEFLVGVTLAISLLSVIIIASLVGTFTPLMLNKYGIDPALATGPFITTSNDIFGLLIYFSIAKIILGF